MTMIVSMGVPNRAATRSLSISGTSAQTAVLNGQHLVVQSTVDCYVIRGDNPTATTSCLPLLANTQYRLTGVKEGEKLAVIAGSSGTFFYTEGV